MADYTEIEVVENPRGRRRKRRRMSAKQRLYFGRRRSNPTLATLTNPRRRRRRSRSRRIYSRRRYSNPAGLGNLFGGALDFNSLLWMSGGAIATKAAPRLIANFWPAIPTTGITGKLVQAGAAVALSQVVKMFAGAKAGRDVLNGGLVYTVTEFLNETVLPMIPGLSGYEYLTYSELEPALNNAGGGAGMAGYVYQSPPEIIAA